MFTEPTVFVVGAGASAEFGMPSGPALQKRIGSALDFRLSEGDRNLYSLLVERFKSDVNRYINAANELSRMIREFPFESIDEALYWFSSSHPEVVTLGKATIVRAILSAERLSAISSPERYADPERYAKGRWLNHFLQMAVELLKREQIKESFSKVTIINFNYDRVIEHFIYSELHTKLKVTEDEAKDAISALKIIRPYGKAGSLVWQGVASSVPFGADLESDHDQLFSLSKNVYTYTEPVTEQVGQDIEAAIKGARLVVFLGFGFHQQNMRLLKINTYGEPKQVIATVLNIDQENYNNMEKDIQINLYCNSIPQLLSRTATELMSTMKPTIMNPRIR
jgi:hypothetical protein